MEQNNQNLMAVTLNVVMLFLRHPYCDQWFWDWLINDRLMIDYRSINRNFQSKQNNLYVFENKYIGANISFLYMISLKVGVSIQFNFIFVNEA
jgi:hypothetical protein